MKMKHAVVSLALSLMLTAGMIPMAGAVSAAATTDTDKVIHELTQNSRQVQNPFAYPTKKMQKAAEKEAESYPASYDLRNVDTNNDGKGDTSFVTPVKLQHPFGSCWGFAAIAAAETSILGSGLAARDGYDATGKNGKELDLSEKHLVHFVSVALNDPDNPQNGEGLYFPDKNPTSAERFNNGGMPAYATSLFSSGVGPNLEDRDTTAFADLDGFYDGIYKYSGAKGLINNQQDAEGNWYNFSYSDGDDWSMPEGMRFSQSYVLKESYILPESAAENDSNQYIYDPAGTAAIKEQLLNRRAVEVAFCADNSRPDQPGGSKYISKNWAHYTYEQSGANHAVTIIGWDDDYPAENFIEGHEPKDADGNLLNGAWLVKNSWGSEERQFPNRGAGDWGILNDQGVHTGYFWLSYYDQSICMAEALEFDKSNVDDQYYLDQHDYMPVNEIHSIEVGDEAKMANVFRADAKEQLEQISCQTAAPGTKVDYDIYLLRSQFEDPEDGILVEEGTETFKYGGFHKIDLKTPAIIQEGQSYSIVITETIPTGAYNINMPVGYGEHMAVMYMLGSWQNGVINEKESYLSVDGAWADYSDEKLRASLFEWQAEDYSFDNFPIKGYCSMIDDTVSMALSDDALSLERGAEKAVKLTIRTKGSSSIGRPAIRWEFAGGDKVFTPDYDPKVASTCTVKAGEAPGKGYLKVTAEGIGSLVIPVSVDENYKYISGDLNLVYGETARVQVKDYNGNIAEGPFTYSSDNEEVATVSRDGTVTATGAGYATITLKDKSHVESMISVAVSQAANKMKARGKTVKLKAAKLAKNALTIPCKKAIKVKKAKGTVTYKRTGVVSKKYSAKFTVDKNTGSITVAKGLRKGIYKVKVKVTSGDNNYKTRVRNVTVRIKVK